MRTSSCRPARCGFAMLLVTALLLASTPAAWAAKEGGPPAAEAGAEGLLKVLLVIVIALFGFVGAGAVTLVLRVILPGLARSADAALTRLSTRRLVLSGILPLVGAALLAQAVQLTGSEVVGGIFGILVLLPIALAMLVGALAAFLHLGAQVWKAESTPLTGAAMGGLVLGLAMLSWVVPPLGVLVTVLVAGWFLGIGLGACLHRAPETTPTASKQVPR